MSEDFHGLPDLANRALGGTVVVANDEFFGGAENLISPGLVRHDPNAFGSRGKLYDGWETRRRRDRGRSGAEPADWAVIRLGMPGIVRGVIVDTSFFTGNYPPYVSVQGATVLGYPTADELVAADWTPLLARSGLRGDSKNSFPIFAADRWTTHVRLTIHPDGGVARFRVHGETIADPRFLGGRIDLAAVVNGGRITGCSNSFYASPSNVLGPGRAMMMSDGWENARRRDDGNDWITVSLVGPGVLHHAVIDTSRFIGNAPGWARLSDAVSGFELLPHTRLVPDTEQLFRLLESWPVGEVRLDVYPDGGISRLRLYGELTSQGRAEVGKRWIGLLPPTLGATIDTSRLFD